MINDPERDNTAVYRRTSAPDAAPSEAVPSVSLEAQQEMIRLEAAYHDLTITDESEPEEDAR